MTAAETSDTPVCGAQYPGNSIYCTLPHGHGQVMYEGLPHDHADPSQNAHWVEGRRSVQYPVPQSMLEAALAAAEDARSLPRVIHVAIGNSDDRLTQAEWADYCHRVESKIRHAALEVHGAWHSLPNTPYQNACWGFEVEPGDRDFVKRGLARIARLFDQESIAWTESPGTEFIGPLLRDEAQA